MARKQQQADDEDLDESGIANWDVRFHYVVNPDGHVLWFPTAAKANNWTETHKRDHGRYINAHSPDDARKIARGEKQPDPPRQRKPRSDKGVKRGPRKSTAR